MKPFKMKVTPEQSEKVQSLVFKHGGKWMSGNKCVQRIHSPFLFFEEGELVRTISSIDFNRTLLPELTYEDFMTMYKKPRKLKAGNPVVDTNEAISNSNAYCLRVAVHMREVTNK